MKNLLKILIPLTLLLFTACEKEELKPIQSSATIRQSTQNEQPRVLAIPHRKTMITRTYTEAFEVLPIKTDEDLITLTADCHDREEIATKYKMTLEQLTIATEIADLKRTGINTDLAATIHAATFVGILDVVAGKTDFIGIVDLVGGKHQTLDVGLLSKMPVKPFYQVISRFIEDQCTNCINTPIPTFETINYIINTAKILPVVVSYEKEGSCSTIDSKYYGKGSSFRAVDFDHPILPNGIVDRKPMIVRSYTESFEILPIKTDQELLALTANCNNREKIASQYRIDLEQLTIATEIADLKRIGLSANQAAILHTAAYMGIINSDLTQTDFIGIIDIISGRNQTLDVGLMAAMPVKEFYKALVDYINNICLDCKKVPSFEKVNYWVQTAKKLSILISYDQNGVCSKFNSNQQLTFSSIENLFSPNPMIPSTNGNIDSKTMITRTYTESFESLPIKTDEDLLSLAANYHDRKKIAECYNMDIGQLTIATEIADLKRIGLSTNQAVILHAAAYFGIIDSDLAQTDFIGIIDIVGGRNQTLDIGLLAAIPVKEFHKVLVDYINNICLDCKEAPSLEDVNQWIQTANQLPVLISYD